MKQARKRIGLCCLLPPTQPVPTVPERAFQLPAATPENYLPKEITRIKRIKIARNDGKHFVDRYVEKKGNEAVKKIERGARQGRGGYSSGCSGGSGRGDAFFPRRSHILQFTPMAGPAPKAANCPPERAHGEDFALQSSPIHLAP